MERVEVPGDVPRSHNNLGLANVGVAALFVALDVVVSRRLRLGLARSLLTASLRCLAQLSLMSLVLRRVFDAHASPYPTAAICAALTLLSAWEVVANKSKRTYPGMFTGVLSSITAGSVPVAAIASRWAMDQQPWWTPERFVPLLGMVLGNSISAVTVSTSFILTTFDSSRDRVELLLAHGASRFEACRPVATEALKLALLPTINQMSVVGLISIPGMMTGAVLAGESVEQAALLQVIILYVISASSATSALLACVATCASLVDVEGRVRAERVSGRARSPYLSFPSLSPATTSAKTWWRPVRWERAWGRWPGRRTRGGRVRM